MGGVAGETNGTFSNIVPGVVAGLPGKRPPERVEEIVECPAHEHIVVRGEHEGDNNSGHANASRAKQGGRTQSERQLCRSHFIKTLLSLHIFRAVSIICV